MSQAFERIRKFKPTHPLPLLSIHIGAFLIEKIRAGTKEEKHIAKQIVAHVQPSVEPLIRKYLKEFKSQLIEIQKGQVKELPAEAEQSPLL